MDIALQAVCKGAGRDNLGCWKLRKLERMQIVEERVNRRRAVTRKEAKDKRKVAKGDSRTCWTGGTHCSLLSKRWKQELVRHG